MLLWSWLLIAGPLSNAISQISIQPDRLAFGTTTPQTEWVVDIIIQNNGAKKDFLLRTTFSHEYDVIATSKAMMPDSTITLRVKFKPREKGPFKENIEFHFASLQEPIIFPVTADVQYLNPADHLACPDFSRQAADCCVDNPIVFEVVNKETGAPIKDAQIRLNEAGMTQARLKTGADGKITSTIPIGYYEIMASHTAYLPDSRTSYVNKRNSYFRLELQPVKNEIIEEPVVPLPDTLAVAIDSSGVLPESRFKYNNLVFLLDASSSMSKNERLPLMQKSVNELVSVLRPGDKVTLISYNDQAKVMLATTSGEQKQAIINMVTAMKADGNTAGAKGFKLGYDILKEEFLKDGNNQLIVVTDGAFQPEDQKEIDKLVKKATRKGLVTSIVGIKSNSYAAENLQLVTSIGRGSFVLIADDADLHQIVEEIKKRSAK